jgi:hypothetical protein
MVETITPVVYGRRARWAAALALHVAGATATAALFGAALGAVGAVLDAPWGRAGAIALAAAAAIYAAAELPRLRAPVPQLRRQVPDWWREFFSWPVAAALYGAGLGVGFFTYVSHGTLVVVALAALASGEPLVGGLVLAPFGLVRGLSAARAAGVRTQRGSQDLVDRLADSSGRPRAVANGVALLAVAAAAAAVAVGAHGGWGSLAAAVLAGVFSWAAASKALEPARWRRTLDAHDLPVGRSIAMFAVPGAEALVPLLVVSGWPRAAAAWALVLLVVFTAEAVRAWLRIGSHVPCGCFGGREPLEPRSLVARNAGLAAVAAVAFVRSPATPLPAALPGWPVAGEWIAAASVVAGLAVAGWTVWAAVRWLGRGEVA